MNQDAAPSPHAIPIRKPRLDFDADMPRYWFQNNIIATHFFNGLNMLFPDGERFFVKAVHDHLGQVHDPVLLEQVRGFAGQEGQHANQHERYFDTLRAQGYAIDEFLRRFRTFHRITSKWPAPLRLAMTAGAEHYTAMFGAGVIEKPEILADVHPTMRKLIVWHATEEIEHKAVAFDVLRATHPSYLLRMLGFLIASVSLFAWAIAGTRMLIKQDRVPRSTIREHERIMTERDGGNERARLRAGIRAYLRRDFHPSQTDELPLAHQRLQEVGLLVAV